MPTTIANGITITYDISGSDDAPPMLLVMGLGAQMIVWDDAFVAALVDKGFRVIRFDNRDVGESTWLDDLGVPDLAAALAGAATAPYLLADMAADAVGLLDALGIESAHIVGASMGGMIVQQMVIDAPARVRSLVSIMSTTGDRNVGQPHPEAMAALLAPRPTDRASAMDGAVAAQKIIGSPGYPFDEERIRAQAGRSFDRGFHPEGFARQLAAILGSPDRTAALREVTCPTLVIHGDDDPLVDVSGGVATAAAIPGAVLKRVPGMGHDLPTVLIDEIASAIAQNAEVAA